MDPGAPAASRRGGAALYSYSDQERNKVFVRYGNSAIGYHHFASKHNLRNRVVFEHLMATKPKREVGARLEYEILAADPNDGDIFERILIVSQQATRTDDNMWQTPDGGYIGVITACCKGKTKCPEFVNRLRSYDRTTRHRGCNDCGSREPSP
ncbi:hypothetical protein [Actinoplanes sp. NPDC049681]|uniref:hypothetical protein n=1 Tax=Actinoplanes sp. NPDC049681 TaxID=3363905 RepID=UPI0037AE0D92